MRRSESGRVLALALILIVLAGLGGFLALAAFRAGPAPEIVAQPAGGDHLHFSILFDGQPVNPQEWWDGHWIRDRVARKLGGALRFEE